MSKPTICDCCGEEINRTFYRRSGSTADGENSAVVKKSLRRRFTNWLLGPLARVKLWDSSGGGRGKWNRLDLCSECSKEIRREVRERVTGDSS